MTASARSGSSPADGQRAARLDRERRECQNDEDCPRAVHRCRSPSSATRAAARTGTPAERPAGGAVPRPRQAWPPCGRAGSQLLDQQDQEEGREDRVEPERVWVYEAVARHHPEGRAEKPGRVLPQRRPESTSRSKRPSPRLASAHEASTTACPSRARRSRPPRSEEATAMPSGANRAFRRRLRSPRLLLRRRRARRLLRTAPSRRTRPST